MTGAAPSPPAGHRVPDVAPVRRRHRPSRPETPARWWRVADWGVQLPILWLVALAYGLAIDPDPGRYAREVAIVSACQALLLAGGYLANDYFDRHQDRRDPRRVPMTPRGARARAMTSASLLALGLATAHALAGGRAAPAIAWAQVLLGLAYSAPGARLKERGAIGLWAAALLQRLPAFAMIALAFPDRLLVAAVLGGWLAWLGLVTILEHQLSDEARDRAAGVRTWCVARGRARCLRARRALYAAFTATTLAAAVLLAWPPATARGVAAALLLIAAGIGFVALAGRRLQLDRPPALAAEDGAPPAP